MREDYIPFIVSHHEYSFARGNVLELRKRGSALPQTDPGENSPE